MEKELLSNMLDTTQPGIKPDTGHLHIMTQAISEIEEIFNSLGFYRVRYPELVRY